MNSSWNYDQNSALPYTLYNVNIAHSKEFAVNQGKYQNFNPSVPPYKSVLIFMEIKQFFEEKKIKMANSKNWDFQNCKFLKKKCENLTDWSLGWYLGLIDAKGTDVAQPVWLLG